MDASAKVQRRSKRNMDKFEERLAEEVRKYRNLYDSSLKDYKNSQMTMNSWREIAKILGTDEHYCRHKWKCLRDRFVKATKRMEGRAGEAVADSDMPYICITLFWLSSFVKPGKFRRNSSESEEVSRKRKLESDDDEFMDSRLEGFERRRDELAGENADEDARFAQTVTDMLRKLPPQQKSLAKFKIHQLLFEMEQAQYGAQSEPKS
ncbi:uncharacterized protein LOC114909421 [Scleropages formosus]|uniref:uncharacterized protein LOC114909421 n=1 Tax=Scleropages formosus TaxID=113540 RepID=UPI0010FA9D1B|nr:uncharacterized protein LOC114909421 [Scleropages formosus]